MFPIILPQLDPILISLGPIAIRWYSLAYIAGILFALFWLKKCNQKDNFLSPKAYEDWITWAVISIMIGGRLGFVIFYNPQYFIRFPLEIFAIWEGGMSFHGGLLGSIFGMWLFAKKYKVDFLKLTDCLSIAAPVGLFFGRLANFMNMELYGRVTGSSFGVIFPNGGDLPRHPSQIYEAVLEGIVIFVILLSLRKLSKNRGFLSGVFLTLYGSFRLLVENFRQPDEQIGLFFDKITMGQALSLPLVFFGIAIVFLSLKKNNY